jgi:hypothetical protein
MGLIDEPICIACGMENESAFHLLDLLCDCPSLISRGGLAPQILVGFFFKGPQKKIAAKTNYTDLKRANNYEFIV